MKTTKRLITTILALAMLLSILAGVTVAALELNEDLVIDDSSSEEELMPMAASGCRTLSSILYAYSNGKYTVNDIKVGHDIPLSNGYYYHAGQFGTKTQVFIYDPSGECIAVEQYWGLGK